MSAKRDEIVIMFIRDEQGQSHWQGVYVNRSTESDTCQKLARENKAPLSVPSNQLEIAEQQRPWIKALVDAGTLKFLKSFVSNSGHKYAVYVPA